MSSAQYRSIFFMTSDSDCVYATSTTRFGQGGSKNIISYQYCKILKSNQETNKVNKTHTPVGSDPPALTGGFATGRHDVSASLPVLGVLVAFAKDN